MQFDRVAVDKGDTPIIIANDIGIIVHVNESFEETFLWTLTDLVDQPISIIIPKNLRDAHNMGFSRFKMSGISTILETSLDLEILTGDGRVILAEHFIEFEERDGEALFVASIVPR